MQASPTVPNLNCWAEIDLDALAHNVRRLQSAGSELMAVLKADAYGHGVGIIAPALLTLGVKSYGVATAAEGAALRRIDGFAASDIYVMTASAPADAQVIAAFDLIPFLSSVEQLRGIAEAARAGCKTIRVHLEIDTGIGRAGILPANFAAVLHEALQTPGIDMTGICTHFTWGENAEDAERQHALFESVLRQVPSDLLGRLTIHAVNSPAMIHLPGARYGMIRPGLLLYGIAPMPEALPEPWGDFPYRSVLSLRARVILARDLPAGASISYGRTFVLDHPARIATVGIGYGDGYSRRLSNRGSVILAGGEIAPIRGRVCMDQICVEVPSGALVKEGDAVTLIGRCGGAEIRAVDIAAITDSAPHEMTTCLTPRVARVAVKSV